MTFNLEYIEKEPEKRNKIIVILTSWGGQQNNCADVICTWPLFRHPPPSRKVTSSGQKRHSCYERITITATHGANQSDFSSASFGACSSNKKPPSLLPHTLGSERETIIYYGE